VREAQKGVPESIIFKPIIMFQFNLKTHRVEAAYQKPHFFILNRGNNSGKPLSEPCPNCFVCLCQSEQEKENLYWILFALWQGRRFNQVLCGSVIPFIRKKELLNLIHQGQKYANHFPDKFQKNVQALQLLQQKEKEYSKLTQSIKELKVVIGHQMIR
jgi:hypothetical protein